MMDLNSLRDMMADGEKTDRIKRWDMDFLEGIERYLMSGKELSDKQLIKLQEIEHKIYGL